jgi:hypothetical protein
MLVKKGEEIDASTLRSKDVDEVDVTVVHARRPSLVESLVFWDPASRCDFLMLASVHVHIGQHDFTGCDPRHGFCLFALSFLVLLISKIL